MLSKTVPDLDLTEIFELFGAWVPMITNFSDLDVVPILEAQVKYYLYPNFGHDLPTDHPSNLTYFAP